MTEPQAPSERQKMNRLMERLEKAADEMNDMVDAAKENIGAILEEIAALRKVYPELPKVMQVEAAGHQWFTDGYRFIRDAWPGEYEPREGGGDMARLLTDWERVRPVVNVVEHADDTGNDFYEAVNLARLSSGAWVNRDWLHDFQATQPLTLHHDTTICHLVILRNADDEVVAGLCPPGNVDDRRLENRRLVGPVEDLTDAFGVT